MKRIQDIVRPMSLMVVASGLFVFLLWLNVLYVDEFASKFILSDKVLRIHQLTRGLLILQLVLMLVLIFGLESTITKKRKAEGAEPDAAPNGGPAERPANSGVTGGPPSVS